LYRTSQAHAAIHGRSYVLPDDVKRVAQSVLAHRMIATNLSGLRSHVMEQIVDDVLHSVAVPVES
jgi:MoxR-like ATPase